MLHRVAPFLKNSDSERGLSGADGKWKNQAADTAFSYTSPAAPCSHLHQPGCKQNKK